MIAAFDNILFFANIYIPEVSYKKYTLHVVLNNSIIFYFFGLKLCFQKQISSKDNIVQMLEQFFLFK